MTKAINNGYQKTPSQNSSFNANLAIKWHSEERVARESNTNASPQTLPSLEPSASKVQIDTPAPLFVAVMGLTGSGKSTLIKQLTGNTEVVIGDGIDPETSEVTEYCCNIGGREFILLDTPGFDESGAGDRILKSDTDVLLEISQYLACQYKSKILLTGIIYLHRISDIKVGGSAVKNFKYFKALCGDGFYNHIAVVTTRWDLVSNDIEKAVLREQELKEKYFGLLIKRGSYYTRISQVNDAVEVLKKFATFAPDKLKIQMEIVDENKKFSETSTGEELNRDVKAVKELLEEKIRELQQLLKEAREMKDAELVQEMEAKEREAQKELERVKNDKKSLELRLEAMEQNIVEMRKNLERESELLQKELAIQRQQLEYEAQQQEAKFNEERAR
ncbi:hypothetical protein HDU99_002658, partial [Rhizoclosmatium hyalinum]